MAFRNYNNSEHQDRVERTYKLMIEGQTIGMVNQMKNNYNREREIMPLWTVFDLYNDIVDESDPDTDMPQYVHAWQTAESLYDRYVKDNKIEQIKIADIVGSKYNVEYVHELYPQIVNWDWLPLIGLIHDMGKIMVLPEYGGLEQWQVVGDTFPLGVPYSDACIFHGKGWHKNNKDLCKNIYDNNCGFDNVVFSWGHDEFMASILENSGLCEEAIYLVRYHSFYPWHDKRGYKYLASEYDWKMLPLLKLFQKSDLYSKTRNIPKIEDVKGKYNELVKKYNLENLVVPILSL